MTQTGHTTVSLAAGNFCNVMNVI